jgi:hypothetical protein
LEYLSEIISFVVGAIAGGFAVSIYSVRIQQKSSNQSGNLVGGDLAGRDIKKK